MRYDPDLHQRRSLRLAGYDYARPGAYFLTLCVQGRECLFGQVVGDEMRLNDAGHMIETWWHKLPQKFPLCGAGTFVVMPNHLHGVIVIRGDVGADPRVHTELSQGRHAASTVGADLRVRRDPRARPASLPRIVQWFKTMTTNAYIRSTNDDGWTPFTTRLWQRNYYEHVVRDDNELARIRDYIVNNPLHWQDDSDNPAAPRPTRGSAPTRPPAHDTVC